MNECGLFEYHPLQYAYYALFYLSHHIKLLRKQAVNVLLLSISPIDCSASVAPKLIKAIVRLHFFFAAGTSTLVLKYQNKHKFVYCEEIIFLWSCTIRITFLFYLLEIL